VWAPCHSTTQDFIWHSENQQVNKLTEQRDKKNAEFPGTETQLHRYKVWSTGRELNPRMQVLQTCALTASPPVPLKRLKTQYFRTL
jgi:hypothetical protein